MTDNSSDQPTAGSAGSTDGHAASASRQHGADSNDTAPDGKDRTDTMPADDRAGDQDAHRPVEIGGQKGPEPTRYGDWEKNGRCTDF